MAPPSCSSEALSLLPPPPPPPTSSPSPLDRPVEGAAPCATLPRSHHLAQVAPLAERCHSLCDLSRSSPTAARRAAAAYATSSSANVSPLRRVLTRRVNPCPHQHRHLQEVPLRSSACTVLLEQPICSSASLWHLVSK